MAIERREETLLQRVSDVFPEHEIRPPNGYLAVLKLACEDDDLDLDVAHVERLWRAASGSAHGMYWPTLELQREVPLVDDAGRTHMVRVADASGITDVPRASYKMTQHAVLRYAECAGADIAALIAEAMQWLVDRVPFSPEADLTAINQPLDGGAQTRRRPTQRARPCRGGTTQPANVLRAHSSGDERAP